MRDYEECLVYVNHLTAEHRRMERLLCDAQAEFESAERGAARDKLVRLLRGVRRELETHFAEEEAGGCLEEAALRCPHVEARIRAIEAEHPKLLAEVDQLIAAAARPDASPKHPALATLIRQLWEKLRAHEQAESDVLSRGFGTIVNGD